MSEHTFLVAVVVDAPTRAAAEHHLLGVLPARVAPVYDCSLVETDGFGLHTPKCVSMGWHLLGGDDCPCRASVDSWWIAEDDRRDRSDNDPAVFVLPGCQEQATDVLVHAGLARRYPDAR